MIEVNPFLPTTDSGAFGWFLGWCWSSCACSALLVALLLLHMLLVAVGFRPVRLGERQGGSRIVRFGVVQACPALRVRARCRQFSRARLRLSSACARRRREEHWQVSGSFVRSCSVSAEPHRALSKACWTTGRRLLRRWMPRLRRARTARPRRPKRREGLCALFVSRMCLALADGCDVRSTIDVSGGRIKKSFGSNRSNASPHFVAPAGK